MTYISDSTLRRNSVLELKGSILSSNHLPPLQEYEEQNS